jgi:hypothetical protein
MNKKIEFAVFKHKALLLCVNNNVRENASNNEVYEGTRFSWRVRLAKVENAEIVVAVIHGVIREVFVANEWLEVTKKNFPKHRAEPRRYGFNGTLASKAIREYYIGKRISGENRLYGPIGYVGF